MDPCPHCDQEFFNESEVQQHIAQVHADKWEGQNTFGQDGDENAVGAVPPTTADYVGTEGNRVRPSIQHREVPEDARRREEERFEELVEEPEER